MRFVFSRPYWCIPVHCKYPLRVMTAFLWGFKLVAGTWFASARIYPSRFFLGTLRDCLPPTSTMADGIKAVFEKRKAEVSGLRAVL
jgi:hypothetical protein